MTSATEYTMNLAMQSAIESGDFSTILSLIDDGFDIETRLSCGQTPLGLAVKLGNFSVSRLFLQKGANSEISLDYEEDSKTILGWGTSKLNPYPSLNELLLSFLWHSEKETPVNSKRAVDELSNNVRNGSIDAVKDILLVNDKILGRKDKDGKTALDWAREIKDRRMIEFLSLSRTVAV